MTKLLVGIDIGSTTTKIVVMEQKNEELEPGKNPFPIIYSDYQRHNAAQLQSVKDALEKLANILKEKQTQQQQLQINAAWSEHNRIVRGNPVRVYSGMNFSRKKS